MKPIATFSLRAFRFWQCGNKWRRKAMIVKLWVILITLMGSLFMSFHFTQLPLHTQGSTTNSLDCPQVPAHFDFLHASQATLWYYGLPTRPSDLRSLAVWEMVVAHAVHRTCGGMSHKGKPLFPGTTRPFYPGDIWVNGQPQSPTSHRIKYSIVDTTNN